MTGPPGGDTPGVLHLRFGRKYVAISRDVHLAVIANNLH